MKNQQSKYRLMLSLSPQKASKGTTSTIYAIDGVKGNDSSLNYLLEFMNNNGLKFYNTKRKGYLQGPSGLFAKNDVVLIKVNSQWDECGMTNTDLVKALVTCLLSHPEEFTGEIIIADNGQAQYGSTGHGGSFDYAVNNAEDRSLSVEKVVYSFRKVGRVSAYLWDTITENAVKEFSDGDLEDGYVLDHAADPLTGVLPSYPKFTTSFGTQVSFRKGIWNKPLNVYDEERLKIINIPVLKSHFIFGVTGAIKHYMGVPSDKLTAARGHRSHSTVGKGGMGTLMAKTRVPTLNILDAIYVNAKPGTGPNTPIKAATHAGVIAASTDPVALDYWASKNILCPLGKEVYKADVSPFNPDNAKKGCFGDWLKLAAEELNKAGYSFTTDEAYISVMIAKKTI